MSTYGIGTVLRAERVRQGLSIDDIARKTKISPKFLLSLEEENFDALPGLVFARGFIRQYSNLLNLDTEDLLSKVPKPETAALPLPDPTQRERFLVSQQATESRWDPRWNSAIASVLWIALGISATVGAYLYFSRTTPANSQSVATTRPAANATKTDATNPSDAPKTSVTQQSVTQQEAGTTSAAPSSPVPENAPPPPSNKPIQVMLTATEPSWVSITADGKSSYSGILSVGDSKTVDADTTVRLIAGNAGGLKVLFNGKEIEPLGPHGQVRNARFTAAGLQPLTPKPPAESPAVPPQN